MADIETIRKRLENYILSRGHTFREVSLKIGRKDSYIQQYVKYGFPKRLNEVDRKKVCRVLNISEKELIDDELVQTASPFDPLFETDDFQGSPEDFVNIDIFAPRPNTDLYQNIIGRMGLNFMEFGSWCAGNPFNLRIIRIDGNYMEPTLTNSSLVIFDSGINEYAGDGVYVLKVGGVVQVKRMQKTDADTCVLRADNPRYHDISCPATEVEILGRAIFSLTGHPL